MKTDQCLKYCQIPIGQAERDSSGSELPQDLPLVSAGRGQVFLDRCLMFQDGSIYRSPERRYRRVVHFIIHEDKNIPVRESLWTCGKRLRTLP
ncbi:replication initiation protein [Donghicola eburneus]|uniref:Replication initiation protein n=1 Tax=Donghicola eburneus TaxID=393278 RepID=A0A1M4MUT6_9RHOB|nr:replication initiation protein [Donghicola eburneus]